MSTACQRQPPADHDEQFEHASMVAAVATKFNRNEFWRGSGSLPANQFWDRNPTFRSAFERLLALTKTEPSHGRDFHCSFNLGIKLRSFKACGESGRILNASTTSLSASSNLPSLVNASARLWCASARLGSMASVRRRCAIASSSLFCEPSTPARL